MTLPTVAALCAAVVAGLPGGADASGSGAAATSVAPLSALRFIVSAGYDVAVGDRLELLRPDGSAIRFRLNGGGFFAAGAAYAPARHPELELRATLGLKQGAAVSTGADVRYRAFPLELLAAWRAGAVHLGLGASVALGASARGADVVSDVHATFATPVGVLGQVEWARQDPGSGSGSAVGVRALWQAVRADGHGTVAAPAVGLFVTVSR